MLYNFLKATLFIDFFVFTLIHIQGMKETATEVNNTASEAQLRSLIAIKEKYNSYLKTLMLY